MNDNVFAGKWDEFKGEVRKMWGKLTGDELEATKGDVESIGGLIQQKYGYKKEEYADKLTELKDRFAEGTKQNLRNSERPDSLN